MSARSARRVLVTGFDAFGDLTRNPTEALVEALANLPGITAAVLPTSYERGWTELERLIADLDPDAIVMFGYARDEPGLRLEAVARRVPSDRPDNDGKVPDPPQEQRGPSVRNCRWPLLRLYLRLRLRSVPVRISRNAGSYVCNHVYYRALESLPRRRRPRCLFVHVGDWEQSPSRDALLEGASLVVAT